MDVSENGAKRSFGANVIARSDDRATTMQCIDNATTMECDDRALTSFSVVSSQQLPESDIQNTAFVNPFGRNSLING